MENIPKKCVLMQSLREFHSTKMEEGGSIPAPSTSQGTMDPVFVESLQFSSKQKQKLLDIQRIWSKELEALQAERRSICASIWVRVHSQAPLPACQPSTLVHAEPLQSPSRLEAASSSVTMVSFEMHLDADEARIIIVSRPGTCFSKEQQSWKSMLSM